MNPINVVCVKWGTKYGPEYVNRLFNGVKKNLTVPFNFICFTEDSNGLIPDVEVRPLKYYKTLEGWWNKIYLFSKDSGLSGKVLFIDLDTVITGNINDLVTKPTKFTVLRDFYTLEDNVGSGLMFWNVDDGVEHIWERFHQNPTQSVKQVHPHGDQKWIQLIQQDHEYWQDVVPNQVVSFKVHCRHGLPKNTRVVCYHGSPSIPESIEKSNSFRVYRDPKLYTVPPARWVLDFWNDEDANTVPQLHRVSLDRQTPNQYKSTNAPTIKRRMNTWVSTYYTVIQNPNEIFGMVGRCGGGYNTVWADWSDQGRINRELIVKEYEEQLNALCGHYEQLEQDILQNGFKNPLVITCGLPLNKQIEHLPPELRNKDPKELLLLEGTTGGSRLWVAQKHNIPVPCIVNDRTGRFMTGNRLTNPAQVLQYFSDKQAKVIMNKRTGAQVYGFKHTHIDEKWNDTDTMLRARAPILPTIMMKYGYRMHIQPELKQYLTDELNEFHNLTTGRPR